MSNLQLRDLLTSRAAGDADEVQLLFSASAGPCHGFNDADEYAVTGRSLWKAHWTAGSLVGGSPAVTKWPRAQVALTLHDDGARKGRLVTPDGESNVAFADAAIAAQAAAALPPRPSTRTGVRPGADTRGQRQMSVWEQLSSSWPRRA